MRYYEIAHRPRTQTETDRIAWNEPRHLQHDARGIWPRGTSLHMSGQADGAKP